FSPHGLTVTKIFYFRTNFEKIDGEKLQVKKCR
ncbi:unnamed protein product, partial [marine sediment metagenome]